jgi:hypothetical protein
MGAWRCDGFGGDASGVLTLELLPFQKLDMSLTGDDGRNDRVFSARL